MSEVTPEILASAIQLAQQPVAKLVEVPPDPNAPLVATADRPVPHLSKASALAAFQALLNSGVPLAEVQAHARAEGFSFGVENRDPVQIERTAIADHLAPSAPKPENYYFGYQFNDRSAGLQAGDLEAFDSQAKQWAASAQLPAADAAYLVEQTIDFARETDRLSEADAETRRLEHEQKLAYFAGRRGCSVEKMLEKARAVLSKGGTFSNRLAGSGALGNAFIVTELADHFDRLATAAKLRGRA